MTTASPSWDVVTLDKPDDVNVSASIRFGLAFCEASGPRFAGHCFVIVLCCGFPVNVLNRVKVMPEVCSICCATANPVRALVAVTTRGRGIDGATPVGVETGRDVSERRELPRSIGYKL
jgi:adenosine/AMP kinase